MWVLHLKRLILENHPAKIPAKVRTCTYTHCPNCTSIAKSGYSHSTVCKVVHVKVVHVKELEGGAEMSVLTEVKT